MRFLAPLAPIAALFLSSCAYQGTIVQKQARPHPLYHSIGIESVQNFVLRDQTGSLHRQMVTPDVFVQYAEGDYFNDLQPGRTAPAEYKGSQPAPATQSIPAPVPMRRVAANGSTQATPSRVTSKSPPTAGVQQTTHAAANRVSAQASGLTSPPARALNSTQSARTQQTAVAQQTATARKPATTPRTATAPKTAATKKTATKKTAGTPSAPDNHRRVAKKASKPWKVTAPSVEPATASNVLPPAEGPAAVAEVPATVPPATVAEPSPAPEQPEALDIPPP